MAIKGQKYGYKIVATNKAKFGEDYYQRIGALGGKVSKGGGFASSKLDKNGLTGLERARIAGIKGGKVSSRKGVKNKKP